MTTLMFDAFNTPAFDPVSMTDAEGVELISSMADTCPVYVRSFQGPDAGDHITVFWTVTPRGEVGTVWEHTRHNAFNVPMGDGDRAVEALRQSLTEPLLPYAQTGYAVGE